MKSTQPRTALAAVALAFALGPATAQDPPRPTRDELARDSKLFLTLAGKLMKWEEPTEPVRIAGPVHFVGTTGLGAYLLATADGHVLLNTGMPSSGPMIVESIAKLGFKVKDVKVIITGHAHVDHVGALAYVKEQTGAAVAVMREDVKAVEDGGKDDFHYGRDWKVMGFPPCKVDRVLRDKDTIKLGDVTLTAHHTPGHTRGATTWVASVVADGKPLVVAWPDGGGINPGYRLANDPSYPGIADDYRRTHHFWEMLKPDVFLQAHTEAFDFAEKRKLAKAEGVAAWRNAEEYRRWVAAKKRAFEDQMDEEMKATKPAK
jgi:metallo-beta-lactamase class B